MHSARGELSFGGVIHGAIGPRIGHAYMLITNAICIQYLLPQTAYHTADGRRRPQMAVSSKSRGQLPTTPTAPTNAFRT